MDKASCAQRLKEIIEIRGFKQVDLSNATGIPKSAISQYFSGAFEPKQDRLYKLAKYLNVSEAWLMGYDVPMERDVSSELDYTKIKNIIPMPAMKQIPLLGTIACGAPILAVENIEDFISIPANINADFALKCKGDSMINARIFDGDIVYIRKQSDVDDGQIAAVLIDDEATLKRVYRQHGKLVLRAENPMVADLNYTEHDLDQIRILGKAIFFVSTVR